MNQNVNIALQSRELPQVSVICVTYNHEKYLQKALDSILAQETEFPFEIIVGDDCSEDGTARILKEYSGRFTGVVVPVMREQNIGAQRNLLDLLYRSRAPYIALCDGDDYWVDKKKLQKQFDHMQSHSQCNVCFHDAQIVFDGIKPSEWFSINDFEPDTQGNIFWPSSHKSFDRNITAYSLSDYIAGRFNIIPTASVFLRWDSAMSLPDWFAEHKLGDFTLISLATGMGTIDYLPQTMSCYRRHPSSDYLYSNRLAFWLDRKGDWVDIMEDLRNYCNLYLNGYCHEELTERKNRELTKLMRAAVKRLTSSQLLSLSAEYSAAIEEAWLMDVPQENANTWVKLRYALRLRRQLGIFPFAIININRIRSFMLRKKAQMRRTKSSNV